MHFCWACLTGWTGLGGCTDDTVEHGVGCGIFYFQIHCQLKGLRIHIIALMILSDVFDAFGGGGGGDSNGPKSYIPY